jgi:uncharacterized membrane protein YidH (DUF202 family)
MRSRQPAPISGPRGHLPGVPSQRTLMAWDRTALALIAHGALLVVRDPQDGSPARWTAAAMSLALALLVAVIGRMRANEISDRARVARVPRRHLLVITAGVLALGVADVASVL